VRIETAVTTTEPFMRQRRPAPVGNSSRGRYSGRERQRARRTRSAIASASAWRTAS